MKAIRRISVQNGMSSYAKRHLADAISLAGRKKESLEIIKSAIERAEEISKGDRNNPKNIYEIAIIRFKMAKLIIRMKDYESALKFLKQSNEEFRTVVDLDPKYRFAIRTIHLTSR